MIKVSIQEEDITTVNIYAPNIGAPHYKRQVLTAIKGEIDNNTIIVGDLGENRTLLHCLWEFKLVQPLWRTVWRFLKKLKIELPYDPAIPLLGIFLEKTIIQKDTFIPIFIATLFTIART